MKNLARLAKTFLLMGGVNFFLPPQDHPIRAKDIGYVNTRGILMFAQIKAAGHNGRLISERGRAEQVYVSIINFAGVVIQQLNQLFL